MKYAYFAKLKNKWRRFYYRYTFRRAIKKYRRMFSATGVEVYGMSNFLILLRMFRTFALVREVALEFDLTAKEASRALLKASILIREYETSL